MWDYEPIWSEPVAEDRPALDGAPDGLCSRCGIPLDDHDGWLADAVVGLACPRLPFEPLP